MGIYAGDRIFGIRIYNFNDDDVSNTLFEEKYDEIMSHEQMKEAYLFYTELNDKNNLFFKVYIECSSALDLYHNKKYMNWCSISLNAFLEKFSI
jgi:hypothetical protein